jgi:hypothetical protein
VANVARSGVPATRQFSLVHPDTGARISGVADNISASVSVDDGNGNRAESEIPVVVVALPGFPGEYYATFVPSEASRTYTVSLRYPADEDPGEPEIELDFEVQTMLDPLFVANAESPGFTAQLGVNSFGADDPIVSEISFRNRSSLSLVSPASIRVVELISTDGETVLQTAAGGVLIATGFGRRQVSFDAVGVAGSYFVRVYFTAIEVEISETFGLQVLPTSGLSPMVDYLRRVIRDTSAPVIFQNQDYLDAIDFALSKLNNDLGTSYLDDSELPQRRKFLLRKLATIEMAYRMIAEEATGAGAGQVSVPDLMVGSGATPAQAWQQLAKSLQAEYDDELAREQISGEQSQLAPSTSIAIRRDARRGIQVEANVAAPISGDLTLAATSPEAGSVALVWSVMRSVWFYRYEVFRASTSAALQYPGDSQRVATVCHVDGEMTDGIRYPRIVLSAPAGTWYYRMAVVNTNAQRTFSPIASVVVS